MAQNTSKPRLIAADTNVLFDLAADQGTAWDAIGLVKKKIPFNQLVVLPTTVQELAFIARRGSSAEAKKLALKAATSLRTPKWDFTPLNCVPVGHGIVEQIARKLRDGGLIPEEEENDSLTLAEAALANVTLLLSSDKHLKDIDATALKLLLDGCHVSTPLIASPWKIVKQFFS